MVMATDWMEAAARAKVNLRLRIFPRCDSDYHPVETILCRVSLADRVRVRFRPERGVSIRVRGPEFAPAGPENLAARAAALFLESIGIGQGVEIELEKRVPTGSGLGGGSSDAAAVLRTLNAAAGHPLEPNGLVQLASQLGADVPFFAADMPLALAWNRGDRLLALPPLPRRPMLLLVPSIAVPTREAYALWDEEHTGGTRDQPSEPLATSWESVRTWEGLHPLAANDFEEVIFRRHPPLRVLKEELRQTDPLAALLSGSGSALFAVYGTREQLDAAQRRLGSLGDNRLISVSGPV